MRAMNSDRGMKNKVERILHMTMTNTEYKNMEEENPQAAGSFLGD